MPVSLGSLAAMKTWELETVRFSPLRRTTATASSSDEAVAVLDVPSDEQCFVRASLTEGNVSWGEFELWCSGARAVARILEHREHDARDPKAASAGLGDLTFNAEDGSEFIVTFAETVSREVAGEAARAWVRDQSHPSVLAWL
jgi:hypothetical protein